MASKALKGLKVLEFGDSIAVPYCAKIFADLGAEVIKIENPKGGDSTRHLGPFPNDNPNLEMSGLFLSLNTSKLGMTLDVFSEQGRKIFLELLKTTDVLIENNPPHKMKHFNLSYEFLKTINSQVIVTSVTPFGWSGPYSHFKGADINVLAFAGVSNAVGDPEQPPLTLPLGQGEYQAGLSAAAGTLLAVLARNVTGRGQHVDIASFQVWATIHQGAAATTFMYIGSTAGRKGRTRGDLYPYTLLRCKDGYICLIAREGRQWKRFLVEVMEREDIASNPKYRDRRVVGEQLHQEMDALLSPWFLERTKSEIFKLCQAHAVPFAPVLDIAEVVNHEHLRAREFFQEVTHPVAGKVLYPGAPYKFSETPWQIGSSAPTLGQDTANILKTHLNFSNTEILRLYSQGTI